MTREAQLLRWKQLTSLLETAEKHGLKALSADEALRLGRLYRQVAIDLSRARASSAHPDEIRYLNQLAARAHGRVYHSHRVDLRPVFLFLLTGFPRLVRQHYVPLLAAAGVFLGSSLASFVAVVREPELAYSLFDEQSVEFENVRLEKQKGEYKGNFTFEKKESSLVAVLIIANNIYVGLRTFAFGALLGLPCLFYLIYNGRMLGTLEGVVFNHGYFTDFNSLILAHGVLELSAICIAGGSGLLLAQALIAPGQFTRREALKRSAPDAFGLFAGSCAMLVVAGIIEGFITPHFSQTVRLSVAGTSAVFLVIYFDLAGRVTPAHPSH